MLDPLTPASARLHRYLEPEPIRRTLERHLTGAEDAGHRLWLLMTLEVWLRQMEQAAVSGAPSRKVQWLEPIVKR